MFRIFSALTACLLLTACNYGLPEGNLNGVAGATVKSDRSAKSQFQFTPDEWQAITERFANMAEMNGEGFTTMTDVPLGAAGAGKSGVWINDPKDTQADKIHLDFEVATLVAADGSEYLDSAVKTMTIEGLNSNLSNVRTAELAGIAQVFVPVALEMEESRRENFIRAMEAIESVGPALAQEIRKGVTAALTGGVSEVLDVEDPQ